MTSTERPDSEPISLSDLTHETFEGVVGTTFRSDAYGALRLVAVHAPEHGSLPGGRRRFTLTFVAEDQRRQPQGMARLEHETLGVLEIFIVPIGSDQTGAVRYEAVFS